MVQSLGNNMAVLLKVKLDLPYDVAVLLLGIHLVEMKHKSTQTLAHTRPQYHL